MSRLSVFLIALIALLLAACSPAATASPPMASPPQAVIYGSPAPMPTALPFEPTMPANEIEVRLQPGDPAQLAYKAPTTRMVIKNASMELLVDDTDRSLDVVTQMASDYGGYILSSRTWYDGEWKYASVTLAVPSDNLAVVFSTDLLSRNHQSYLT